MQRFGQSGLLAMQGYNQDLKDIGAQRQQALTQGLGLFNMAKQANAMDAFNRTFDETGGAAAAVANGVQPQAGVSPRTAAQFGAGPAGFTPMPNAPLSVPPGTNPANVNGYQPPNWRTEMPPALKIALLPIT